MGLRNVHAQHFNFKDQLGKQFMAVANLPKPDGAKKITDGNTKEIEQMLYTHAKTLDYVFYDALSQLADCSMINQIETYANIAFRAHKINQEKPCWHWLS